MPNIKSAIRRAKKTVIQTKINRLRKSKYKSAIKTMQNYILKKNIKEAESFMPKFHSQLMKIAKTGAIDKRTASRKISRFSKNIKNIKKTI